MNRLEFQQTWKRFELMLILKFKLWYKVTGAQFTFECKLFN